jgi:hypothetical protein
MLVALQLVAAAVVPLKFTVLVPCVAPKFVPVIVTAVPTAPDVGDKLATVGAAARTSLAHSNNREKARTGTSFHPLWCINVTSAFDSRGRWKTTKRSGPFFGILVTWQVKCANITVSIGYCQEE